jgi:hypothetical protein
MTIDYPKLHESLWKKCFDSRFHREYSIEQDNAYMTDEVWAQVLKDARDNAFAFTPGSGVFGFGFSMSLWKPAPPAPYPGTEDLFKPECLLSVTSKHFDQMLEPITKKEKQTRSHAFWNLILEPLVYSKGNLRRLAEYGFEKPRDMSYYDY